MRLALRERVEERLEASITSERALSGGCLSLCMRALLSDGREVVIKHGDGYFLLEERMLSDLRNALSGIARTNFFCTSPRVYYADSDMLVMEWIAHGRVRNSKAYEQAGELLARLHSLEPTGLENDAGFFGFAYDTPLGKLMQDNRRSNSWSDFYRTRRIVPLAERCLSTGVLDSSLHRQVLVFSERLDDLLSGRCATRASLVHGDLWSANMLFDGDGLRALIDPALYYGDGLVDLAMLRLFPAFDESFFSSYRASIVETIDSSTERLCMDVYSVYPLLVHCLFFGSGYCEPLARVLHRYVG